MSIWYTEELHPYYGKGIRVKRVPADEKRGASTFKSSRPKYLNPEIHKAAVALPEFFRKESYG